MEASLPPSLPCASLGEGDGGAGVEQRQLYLGTSALDPFPAGSSPGFALEAFWHMSGTISITARRRRRRRELLLSGPARQSLNAFFLVRRDKIFPLEKPSGPHLRSS